MVGESLRWEEVTAVEREIIRKAFGGRTLEELYRDDSVSAAYAMRWVTEHRDNDKLKIATTMKLPVGEIVEWFNGSPDVLVEDPTVAGSGKG